MQCRLNPITLSSALCFGYDINVFVDIPRMFDWCSVGLTPKHFQVSHHYMSRGLSCFPIAVILQCLCAFYNLHVIIIVFLVLLNNVVKL